MGMETIIVLALALSMDAFAVSVVNGMGCRARLWRHALASGLAFGVFQGIMPILGFLAGHSFSAMIQRVDHWIALALLCVIGGKMIWEALRNDQPDIPENGGALSLKKLGLQAVATSIDALAIGVWLGLMQVNILMVSGIIAFTTFVVCVAGVCIGGKFGGIFRKKAEVLGGVILILLGVKIVLEHTGYLP